MSSSASLQHAIPFTHLNSIQSRDVLSRTCKRVYIRRKKSDTYKDAIRIMQERGLRWLKNHMYFNTPKNETKTLFARMHVTNRLNDAIDLTDVGGRVLLPRQSDILDFIVDRDTGAYSDGWIMDCMMEQVAANNGLRVQSVLMVYGTTVQRNGGNTHGDDSDGEVRMANHSWQAVNSFMTDMDGDIAFRQGHEYLDWDDFHNEVNPNDVMRAMLGCMMYNRALYKLVRVTPATGDADE